MKSRLAALLLLFLIGCQNKSSEEEKKVSKNGIFETSFENYKELHALKSYEKISDTSIHMGGWQDDYRLMHLKEKRDELVLFYKVADRDSLSIVIYAYQVLDTLRIKDLKEDERITIGYCYNEEFYEGEIISLIKETDSLQVQNLIRAWRANPKSESVEELEDFEEIICINEAFESEEHPVSVKHLNLKSRSN